LPNPFFDAIGFLTRSAGFVSRRRNPATQLRYLAIEAIRTPLAKLYATPRNFLSRFPVKFRLSFMKPCCGNAIFGRIAACVPALFEADCLPKLGFGRGSIGCGGGESHADSIAVWFC
jgi:hypothetical protein